MCVCVIGYPIDTIELVPVSAKVWFHNPFSITQWEERCLAYLAPQK